MNSFETVLVLLILASSLAALILSIRSHYRVSRLIEIINVFETRVRNQSGVIKPRKRYIAFSIVCDKPVTREQLEDSFTKLYAEYFGKALFHKASPQFIFFMEDKQVGVLRVSHLYKDHALAVLGILKQVNDSKCIAIPLKTCGSLKKCRKILEKY
ncbi:MAG: Rpp14/Pop5 family protein [Desulfurococcus sp.]|uniref:Rpp14/Pop5 family protein n=1 Tax=Desulfurococcus sp. TaxID=51678 RepID=UPI0031655BF9